jgi:hypothetical protein
MITATPIKQMSAEEVGAVGMKPSKATPTAASRR